MKLQTMTIEEFKTYAGRVRQESLDARTFEEVARHRARYQEIQDEASRRWFESKKNHH